MTRAEKAMENFKQGYNCAQAVVLAFSDLIDMDNETLARVSSSFGGGMGRLREVCGAVSGMFMVTGILLGYSDPEAKIEKMELYKKIQQLGASFKETNGSLVCRELLAGQAACTPTQTPSPTPSERTAEFYKKRPCVEFVGDAASMLEKLLIEEGVVK